MTAVLLQILMALIYVIIIFITGWFICCTVMEFKEGKYYRFGVDLTISIGQIAYLVSLIIMEVIH